MLTTPGHAGTGASPHTVVHQDNKLRLLRLLDDNGQPRTGPPVLFVSAPVSRYFVLDLLPGRSFVGTVGDAGFDVYLIDFGEPDQADRFADLDYYVNGLLAAVRAPNRTLTGTRPPSVVGYCLGGTLALLYTALHPKSVSRLALLTTTIDGDVKGGIPWTAHCLGLPGESYDNPGWSLPPTSRAGSKCSRPAATAFWAEPPTCGTGWTNRWNGFATSARWRPGSTMSSPPPGRLLAELYREFGPGRNGLINGTAQVGGQPMDLDRVTMPVLSVSAAKDTIAPPEGVDAISRVVPHAEIVRLPRRARRDRRRPGGQRAVGHDDRLPPFTDAVHYDPDRVHHELLCAVHRTRPALPTRTNS